MYRGKRGRWLVLLALAAPLHWRTLRSAVSRTSAYSGPPCAVAQRRGRTTRTPAGGTCAVFERRLGRRGSASSIARRCWTGGKSCRRKHASLASTSVDPGPQVAHDAARHPRTGECLSSSPFLSLGQQCAQARIAPCTTPLGNFAHARAKATRGLRSQTPRDLTGLPVGGATKRATAILTAGTGRRRPARASRPRFKQAGEPTPFREQARLRMRLFWLWPLSQRRLAVQRDATVQNLPQSGTQWHRSAAKRPFFGPHPLVSAPQNPPKPTFALYHSSG